LLLIIPNHGYAYVFVGQGSLGTGHGNFRLYLQNMGLAVIPPGAAGAVGLTTTAESGPQIHQGLVKVPRVVGIEELLRQLPEVAEGLGWGHR